MAKKQLATENEIEDAVDQLLEKAADLQVPEDCLEEAVLEIAEQLCESINRTGMEAQLRFLLTNGMSLKQIRDLLETHEDSL